MCEMIRGISFQVPNEHGQVLSKMLDNTDTDQLFWYNAVFSM